MTMLCDGGTLSRMLEDLASAIAARRRPRVPLALVGIRTRGVPIARRIAHFLRDQHQLTPMVGAVDITLYRDDLDKARRWPVLRGTEIDFPVDDVEIVLVDDVLYTGRSARAAMNTVCDLGRPACVRLAVVVDRGQRELPIQADYVGMSSEADSSDRIIVRIEPVDEHEGIERVSRVTNNYVI